MSVHPASTNGLDLIVEQNGEDTTVHVEYHYECGDLIIDRVSHGDIILLFDDTDFLHLTEMVEQLLQDKAA